MANFRTRLSVLVSALAAATAVTGLGIVATASPVNAAQGGCPSLPHNVHTTDASPRGGWACWIDNGDDIRVCDDDPNDGLHAHADIWIDYGIGVWQKFGAEDDGEDAGCDDQDTDGNLAGTQRIRLRVCQQNGNQVNTSCGEIIWWETE